MKHICVVGVGYAEGMAHLVQCGRSPDSPVASVDRLGVHIVRAAPLACAVEDNILLSPLNGARTFCPSVAYSGGPVENILIARSPYLVLLVPSTETAVAPGIDPEGEISGRLVPSTVCF